MQRRPGEMADLVEMAAREVEELVEMAAMGVMADAVVIPSQARVERVQLGNKGVPEWVVEVAMEEMVVMH